MSSRREHQKRLKPQVKPYKRIKENTTKFTSKYGYEEEAFPSTGEENDTSDTDGKQTTESNENQQPSW